MAKPVSYFVTKGELPETEFSKARLKIANVLHNPYGWQKYGYRFNEHLSPTNKKALDGIFGGRNKVLAISFFSNDTLVKRFGGGMNHLSCYIPYKHSICINIDNWYGGSRSNLPLERYRNYVINHEVGHALGLGHPKRNEFGQKASVMEQMSKGPEHVYPGIENDWPLDPNEWDEFKNNKHILGGMINLNQPNNKKMLIIAGCAVALTVLNKIL